MADLSDIVDRVKFHRGKEILPGCNWSAFLDEIQACAEIVGQEARSLRANREQLLTIINLIPVAFFVKDPRRYRLR